MMVIELYGTVQMQVYTCESCTFEYVERHSHSQCELSGTHSFVICSSRVLFFERCS